jgi:hypothetical protein
MELVARDSPAPAGLDLVQLAEPDLVSLAALDLALRAAQALERSRFSRSESR